MSIIDGLKKFPLEHAAPCKCIKCGRQLGPKWSPVGYGPVCAKRMGLSLPKVERPPRAPRPQKERKPRAPKLMTVLQLQELLRKFDPSLHIWMHTQIGETAFPLVEVIQRLDFHLCFAGYKTPKIKAKDREKLKQELLLDKASPAAP